MTIFSEKELLIASKNEGKVKEIRALLAPFDVEVISAANFDIEEPEETGSTFAENAALKAEYYGKATNLPALADDSGLSIEALGGAPGIYSARWAGAEKDFAVAMKRVEEELQTKGADDYSAKFVCSLALWVPEGSTDHVEGEVKGTLTFPARGNLGFGYDPIFIPEGHDRTFAEMTPEEKASMSHRTRAFKALIDMYFLAEEAQL